MRELMHPGVVFLDRDGTINAKAPSGRYVVSPASLSLLPGAARGIRRLNDAGVKIAVVTNQRGIALGFMTEDNLDDVHAALNDHLAAQAGAHVDAFFYCPHDYGACDCRKPATGMFRQARQAWPWIDLTRSVVVGDSATDVEAGQRLGLQTVLLGVDAADLDDAVAKLLPREPAFYATPAGQPRVMPSGTVER